MHKRVAEVREGNEDSHGVYGFIRDLIVEGRDARFVNKRGRYVISWSEALDRYVDFKSKKNPQFKCKKFNRRKASNGLRAALLNFYKKEGAWEYKESKKVNENDEVVERQFQMPPRVFESLFKDVKLSDDSEPDEQDTSSIKSEGESEAQSPSHSSTSDAGFDETMDMTIEGTFGVKADIDDSITLDNISSNPFLNVVKTEEDGDVFLPDTIQPSEMFDTSAVDSALEEICSDGISDDISDDLDLLGAVQDICPMSGSVKGGYQFYISLTEQLPDDVTTGIVQFEGVANVEAQKLNPYTLSGIVPSSHQPGDVPVTVLTAAGQRLGMTCFRYIDEMREMVRQMVKDPALQSLWFAMWSQEHGFFGADSDISQVIGPVNMPNQDSYSQTKQQQSLKILQLLVYTAAETDARQFIDMIFSTSAGKIIFNSYKDKTPLPEDIARANGHEDLAQYLQDLNIRLSKEVGSEGQSKAIDWLELVKAVQTQAFSGEEPSSRQKHPSESDDKSSDYFADAEMSSCGSIDVDEANHSDSEDKDSRNEGFCTKDAASNEEPNKRQATSMKEPTNEIPDKKEELADNKVDQGSPRWWHSFSLSGWLSKWRKSKATSPMPPGISFNTKDETDSSTLRRFPGVTFTPGLFDKGSTSGQANEHTTGKPRTAKPKECGQNNYKRSSKRAATGLKYKGFLLAFVMVTVLAGLKLGEGYVLHWAVGNGYTRISKLLLHCGVYVNAPGFFKETPLHLAAEHGFKDLVDILVQNGGNVNARNFPSQEIPLHLAAQNGHRYIAEFLIKHGSEVNARNAPQKNTPLHLATQYGHSQVAVILIQHGSDVNARNFPSRETPLHLAARYGLQHIADSLIQHGSQVNAFSNPSQESPLHLAAQNGHSQVVDVLLQCGSDVSARNKPFKNTPLHHAARNGHKQVVDILLRHGSDVNARNVPRKETPLHLAAQNGHQHVVQSLILHGGEVSAQTVPYIGQETKYWSRKELDDIIQGRVLCFHCEPWQETPLHLASQNGHKQVVDILLQRGSDVNARNAPGKETPLHLAAQNGHQYVVESLIQHGSQINARSDPWRETSLHLAARNGHQHIVESLVQHGGQINARNDPWQETSLHLALQNGHKEVANILLQHRREISENIDLMVEKGGTVIESDHTCVPTAQKELNNIPLDALSPNRINVYSYVTGILVLNLVVACLLLVVVVVAFRVLTTNGSTEPNGSPCLEPLLECPGIDIIHTSNKAKEYLQDLSVVDISMEKASIKELQLERVRSWLNEDLDPGVVQVSSNFCKEMIMYPALEIKAGVPSGQELYNLSVEVGVMWKKLGRALAIPDAMLEIIDKDECQASKKCFNLLLLWKQRSGKLATYTALEACLHAVQRSDLAKTFCYSSGSVKLLSVCEG